MGTTHNELEKTLKEINSMLSDKNITAEEEEKLQKMAAKISGTLLKNWLPNGVTRRLIMLVIIIIMIYGIINISGNFIFLGFLLIFFSPRIIGEIMLLSKK